MPPPDSGRLSLRGQAGPGRVVRAAPADYGRAAPCADSREELDVDPVEALPLGRYVSLEGDRLDRADRLARTAVHALVRVDVEHPVALVDAVDGALVDAGLVEQVDAGQRDDVGHVGTPF